VETVSAIFRPIEFVAREKTLESQWPLLVLSLILLYNLVESDLLVPNSFLWAAYVVVTVSMQRIAGESRVALRNELPGDSATNEFPGSEFEPCPQWFLSKKRGFPTRFSACRGVLACRE